MKYKDLYNEWRSNPEQFWMHAAKNINWVKISEKMKRPSWVFDTRGILDKIDIQKAGINIWQLGDGGINNLS